MMLLIPSRIFMRQSTSRAIATITTLAFLFLPLPAVAASKSAAQTQYAVVSLGVLDNAGSSTVLRRTNSRGEVVGGYRQGGRSETAGAFLLSSTGILFHKPGLLGPSAFNDPHLQHEPGFLQLHQRYARKRRHHHHVAQ